MMEAWAGVGLSMWLSGLLFGGSACLFSCLPALGGVALAEREGGVAASVARFNVGRVLGYLLLGAISGGIGASLARAIGGHESSMVFGALMVLAGLMLWRNTAGRGCGLHRHGAWRGSLVGMGLGMSLTPCAPLGTMCAAAAGSGSVLIGGLLGLAFALGAVLPAQVVFGHGMAMAGGQLRMQAGRVAARIGRGVAVFWIVLGGLVAAGWVRL
ncbi:MAG: sulfite exporter TauE/SafE family protein [Mariprofundaceae bacterium]